MKLIKIKLLLLLIICGHYIVSADNGISLTMHRANKLYKEYAYKNAAALYEVVLKKKPRNYQAQLNIANCYRKMNDMAAAEKWYSKVVENENTEAENYLFYAQSLEFNGKLNEAKVYYRKFTASANMDKRGERKLKSIENRAAFYTDSSYYIINNVSFNTKGNDYGITFSNDGFSFVSDGIQNGYTSSEFLWNNRPFSDIFKIRSFDERDSVFTSSVYLSKYVNSKYNEGPMSYDKDGKILAFSRNAFYKGKVIRGNQNINHQQIYIASDRAHQWKNIKPFPRNNPSYSACHPTFSNDGKTMYFVSDMPGGYGGTDIYMSKNENGKWTEPTNMGIMINTEGDELFPWVLNDSILYFASNGHGGLGGLDIYTASIYKGEIKEAANMGYPINTTYDDFGLIYNKSKKIGFFSSNRPGGKGNDDIYRFVNIKPDLKMKIIVNDIDTKEKIKKAKVNLYDANNKLIGEYLTNDDGEFAYPVIKETTYHVMISYDKYFDQALTFDTKNMEGFEKLVEIPIYKDLGFNLVGKIFESNGQTGIEEVNITIKDVKTGATVFEGKTNAQGEFQKNLSNYSINQTISYEVRIEKQGYIAKTIYYSRQLTRSGNISLNEDIDLKISKLKVGTDIGRVFNLNPIYFDSGKWDIRDDAKIELDKIVKALIDNPSISIEIGSHTDSRGAAKSNTSLSDKRAKSTVEYIISKGIDKARITGKGYGESQLVNKCKDGVKCSEEEHQQNRRTEFKITKT